MCAFLILRVLLNPIELIVKTNNHTHRHCFHGNGKKQKEWSVGNTFSLRSKTTLEVAYCLSSTICVNSKHTAHIDSCISCWLFCWQNHNTVSGPIAVTMGGSLDAEVI